MSSLDAALTVDAPVYDTTYGEFVSAKHARFAEVLHDYNPYFSLVFIPSSQRDETDTHPFAILDSSPAKPRHIIKHISEREMDNPEEILAWIFEGDLSKHSLNAVIDRALLKKQAAELLQLKRDQDLAAERQELAAALIQGGRDKKHFYRHNGKTFRN